MASQRAQAHRLWLSVTVVRRLHVVIEIVRDPASRTPPRETARHRGAALVHDLSLRRFVQPCRRKFAVETLCLAIARAIARIPTRHASYGGPAAFALSRLREARRRCHGRGLPRLDLRLERYVALKFLTHDFLPKSVRPPFQTILFFPGAGAIQQASCKARPRAIIDHIINSGRAVMYPVARDAA